MQRACKGKRNPRPCSYTPMEVQRAGEKVGAVFHSMTLPNRSLKIRRYGHVSTVHTVPSHHATHYRADLTSPPKKMHPKWVGEGSADGYSQTYG
jgi:hypothetical protein